MNKNSDYLFFLLNLFISLSLHSEMHQLTYNVLHLQWFCIFPFQILNENQNRIVVQQREICQIVENFYDSLRSR
jgi:hypothetical protein